MKKNNTKYHQQDKITIKENSLNITKKRNNTIIYVIIAFIVPVLLYLQTINYGLTNFDDNVIITNNITFLSHIENAQKAFLTEASIGKTGLLYRPLQTLSYMIDIQFSGAKETWMFHLSNILLLGLIACSLFLLLKRFLIPLNLALLGTLIYITNPLFVSSVAWIPARGDLQLTFFSILSFIFFIDFLQKRKIIYLFLNWIAFTIALFSKETAALLPFIFILYYFTFQSEKRIEKKYLFNFLLYAISGIFWFWLHTKAIGSISNKDDGFGLGSIISNLRIIPESLTKFLFPFDNNPLPVFSIFKTLMGIVILVMIIVIFFKNKERLKKEKIFCFIWFIFLMLPPMLIKPSHIDYLDHRFLLPLVGILLFILFSLPKKWFEKGVVKKYGLMIAIIIFLSSFSYIKSNSYTDPMTYYSSAISHNPNSSLAYNNRGQIKSDRNDFQGAIEDYNKAISINPSEADAYNNRGLMKQYINDLQGALNDFNKAITIRPNYAKAYNSRGIIKANMKDQVGAIDDYSKAITFNPNYAEAYNNRGNVKIDRGDFKGAIEDIKKAITIRTNFAEAYNNIGTAMVSCNNLKDAIIYFSKAIEINPNYIKAYNNRGNAKVKINDKLGAIEDYNKAIAIRPDNAEAYFNKGIVVYANGNLQEAMDNFNKAIEINPNYLNAYFNRAVIKYNLKDLAGVLEDCDKILKLNSNYKNALILKVQAQQILQNRRVN